MYFTRDFRISLTMLGKSTNISNKGFLSILQDIAEMHSASIGYGVTDIEKTNYSWALLNWKVKILSRPKYGEIVTIKTWARQYTKLYCYRDFEVFNSKGESIAIISSKWILIDVLKGKIARLENTLLELYQPENKSVFDIVELDKLSEPQSYLKTIDYTIRKSDIDINEHVNNLCYLDIALEAFPGDSNEFNDLNEFEILYKHQIKINDKITASYCLENDKHCIVIKSADGKTLHSILKFK